MSVVYYNTLMNVAYGKESGLGGHIIPAKKLEDISNK